MYTPKFYYIDKGPEITVRELKIVYIKKINQYINK